MLALRAKIHPPPLWKLQDCFASTGAHTGEVSASMLSDAGVGYTLVGHSERRAKVRLIHS